MPRSTFPAGRRASKFDSRSGGELNAPVRRDSRVETLAPDARLPDAPTGSTGEAANRRRVDSAGSRAFKVLFVTNMYPEAGTRRLARS